MHEYARIDTDRGPVWLCKDTVDGTLEQTIVADVDDVDDIVPEVPLRRRREPVRVDDRSSARRVDLSLDYTNLEGRAVHVDYRGPKPTPVRWRNSSTMKHSRDQLIAVLDLSHAATTRKASIAYDGEPARLYRIAHAVPFAAAILQTQGGFSIGALVQRDGTTRHASGAVQAWATERTETEVTLVQTGPLRTLRHVFRRVGEALELSRVEAWPEKGDVANCVVHFVPSLPDLRFAPGEPWEGCYVVDVGGGLGHAIVRIRVERDGDDHRVDIVPDAPRWTRDRPMRATVRVGDGAADVSIVRID
jgi:hypothetical protein